MMVRGGEHLVRVGWGVPRCFFPVDGRHSMRDIPAWVGFGGIAQGRSSAVWLSVEIEGIALERDMVGRAGVRNACCPHVVGRRGISTSWGRASGRRGIKLSLMRWQ